jgi:hypothetical protein
MATNFERKWKYIRIQSTTQDRLRKFAMHGDTWDMVLQRVLDMVEKNIRDS